MNHFKVVFGILFTFLTVSAVMAQSRPLAEVEVALNVTSGATINELGHRTVIFNELIEVPNAAWLRLNFGQVSFGDTIRGGQEAIIRLTSLKDGAVQTLNRLNLSRWNNTSAYFNGNALLVELITDPGSGPASLEILSAWAGESVPSNPESICGPTDDRILSNDPRNGRILPVGCTGWLINDKNKCFLTAGHCDGGNVVQFNVPLSTSGGALNHPPPEDQYPIDLNSYQSNGGGGVGNDWAYFGTFPNSETGLTAYEAQGRITYILADPPADPTGMDIRITGYGSTSLPLAPLEWYLVQKTHVGPLIFVSGNTVNYQTDTTGGNSGSPIVLENTGEAIGIHTHAGCSASQGNNGTNILHPALQNALANPTGVCTPGPFISFTYPNGLPEFLDPVGQRFSLIVTGIDGASVQAASGMLHYDIGEGLVSIPLVETSPNNYDAVFPALACGARVAYYFSAVTDGGTTITSPEAPEVRTWLAEVATELDVTFADNFQADLGWTVQNDASLTDGGWERGVPQWGGLRSDPGFDADGSGACFLTGNSIPDSDVDGGPTTLLSPTMDASQGDAYISYWRWYATEAPFDDVLLIEVSDDDGANWTTLEALGPTGPDAEGGWIFSSFRVADFVTANTTFRIRFRVADAGQSGIVEAGIDGVRLSRSQDPFICENPCFGDLNMDGTVDDADLLFATGNWGNPGSIGDLNGDGLVEVLDLISLISAMGACP